MANDFKRKYNRSSISFGETIGTVFENGPPVFKKLSTLIRLVHDLRPYNSFTTVKFMRRRYTGFLDLFIVQKIHK